MSKERKINALSKFIDDQQKAYELAQEEGHKGRQKRLREAIMTSRIENILGARISNIPEEIKKVVKNKLPEAALRVLWYSPCVFLWREENDPLSGDFMKSSPSEMWKDERYREDVMDFVRVMVDSLES